MLQDGVELNWLPPTEPNGEVHYVIEYKREDSGDWTSVNTTSDSTHYNLTGPHSGTNYIIRVVAVNSAGRAPTISGSNSATVNIAGIVAGAAAAFLLILTLLTAGVVLLVVLRRAKQTAQGKQGSTTKNAKFQLNKDTAAATKGREGTADHTYDYVNDEGCTEGRGALYQGLDVKTQDYVSAYSQLQLGGGAYQELDYQSREEEHHYHRANNGRKKHGERND